MEHSTPEPDSMCMYPHLEIKLTQGHVAIVCAPDYEWLVREGNKWSARRSKKKVARYGELTWYARRSAKKAEAHRPDSIYLHREILGVGDQDVLVDHEDNNTLNCCRHNLRIVTSSQSNLNRRKGTRGKSPFKGACQKRGGDWCHQLWVSELGKCVSMWDVADEAEAGRDYDKIMVVLNGEYANLNFPDAAYSPQELNDAYFRYRDRVRDLCSKRLRQDIEARVSALHPALVDVKAPDPSLAPAGLVKGSRGWWAARQGMDPCYVEGAARRWGQRELPFAEGADQAGAADSPPPGVA